MGLNVNVLTHARLCVTEEECKSRDECMYEKADMMWGDGSEYMVVFCNPHFPVQREGLVNGIYGGIFSDAVCPSWSYGGYNNFRSELAIAVGYTSIEHVFNAREGILWELINFSDCEGTFNNKSCKKIADELLLVDVSKLGDFNARMFARLKEAFEDAANNDGIVLWS